MCESAWASVSVFQMCAFVLILHHTHGLKMAATPKKALYIYFKSFFMSGAETLKFLARRCCANCLIFSFLIPRTSLSLICNFSALEQLGLLCILYVAKNTQIKVILIV